MSITSEFTRCIQPNFCLTAVTLGAALLAPPAVSRADTIYVSNAGPDQYSQYVEKYSQGGAGTVFFSAGGLNWPVGLAFDSAGNLYVADSLAYMGTYTILKITPDGVGSVFSSSALLNKPVGLAFDTAGNLYAATYSGNTIVKITPSGAVSVFATTLLSTPYGLAFDTSGNLFVCNKGNNTIVKFTPGGVGSVFANSNLNAPQGLAFDADGNLYAANSGNNTIEKFTSAGVGSLFASSNLNDPVGLAFDSVGSLYAVNFFGNSVTKFAPDGSSAVVITNGLNQPTFIVIVPEPAAPQIITQPKGQVGYWGMTASFQVKAASSLPLSYQWLKDGFPIAWATNSTLTLTNLDFTDTGNYWVVVSNTVASVTSSTAPLVVNPAGVSLGLYPGLTIQGVVGRTYGIQSVATLNATSQWTTLTSITLTQPVQLWTDTNADASLPSNPQRFYRVVAIP